MSNSIDQYYEQNFGPIAHYFIQKLDEYIEYFDDGDTAFLFCARAGVSIYDLYELYLSEKNRELPENCKILWASRWLCAKNLLGKNENSARTLIEQEYANKTGAELAKALAPKMEAGTLKAFSGMKVADLITSLENKNAETAGLQLELKQQADLFDKQLEQATQGKKRIILIDSGWQGTIQSLIQHAYPKLDIHGLYFGRIALPATDTRYFAKMHGLVFEEQITNRFYDHVCQRPGSVFAVHRHIVENIFETDFSSVESLALSGDKAVPCNADEIGLHKPLQGAKGLSGVASYLKNNTKKHQRGSVQQAFFQACNALGERILHPDAEDLQYLGGMSRSKDFGDSLSVGALLEPKNRHEYDSTSLRIEESLWSHGQAAVECSDPKGARKKQLEFGNRPEEECEKEIDGNHVAIITRTKNRPVLLRRAAESVREQSYKNYSWIVVNDGGELQPVIDVINESAVDLSKVTLVSNPESLGMEAASNRGIRHSNSDYVVIHDDDDAWHPDFLKKSVECLQNKPAGLYDGVLCKTEYVSEEIIDDKSVVIHSRRPYNHWVETVSLTEMAHGNFFAPIAFMFSRAVYDDIGGYDETLPVLGDWDFNLRFLCKTNIAVLGDQLAYYHHRDVNSANNAYSNSVIGGISKHQEYEPIVRNKYARMEKEYPALSHIMTSTYSINSVRHSVAELRSGVQTPVANSTFVEKDRFVAQMLSFERSCGKSGSFDSDRYLQKNADLNAPLNEGILESALGHYIEHGYHENRPCDIDYQELEKNVKSILSFFLEKYPSHFDEAFYFEKHADVKRAKDEGTLRSAVSHYLANGIEENREFRIRTERRFSRAGDKSIVAALRKVISADPGRNEKQKTESV